MTVTGEPSARKADACEPESASANSSAVKCLNVARESRLPRLPHFPRRMQDLILHAAAVALGRVSPVMLGDELLFRAISQRCGIALRMKAEFAPVAAKFPSIRGVDAALGVGASANLMRHGQRQVILVIERSRNEGYGRARYDLTDENDTPALPALLSPFHIEPEVHFRKVGMKWNSNPENPGIQEAKSDEAYKGFRIPAIEFGAARDVRKEKSGVDFVIQQNQITPLRGQEDSARVHTN